MTKAKEVKKQEVKQKVQEKRLNLLLSGDLEVKKLINNLQDQEDP